MICRADAAGKLASRRRLAAFGWIALIGALAGCDGRPFGFGSSQPASRQSAVSTNAPAQPPVEEQETRPHTGQRRLADAIAISSGTSAAQGPLDLCPADAMLTLYSRPLPKDLNPDTGGQYGPGSPSALNTVWNIVSQVMARTHKPAEVVAVRLGEGFLEAINYPYALVLLECTAEPLPNRPTAVRIDGLRVAGIVKTDGRSERFLALIAKTVDSVTSHSQAELLTKEAHGWRYQTLRDGRLEADEPFEWGQIGDHFVLAFGQGVFERVAAAAAGAAPALSKDEWFAKARAERAENAYLELFVGAQRTRELLDPHVQGAASNFFQAWDAGEMERAHWSFGMLSRAMFCVANFRIANTDLRRVYADALQTDAPVLATVPPETNYAVWRLPVERFLNRFFAALVATREPAMQARIRGEWERLQREYKFDAQRDVLDNLGETIVQHKFPMHPLRIPICVTTLVEIRANPQQVARTIDLACTAWQQGIIDSINKGIVMPATLTRDDEGIWFLNFGLAGPAWIVTDKFIVASWSPQALREYLAVAGQTVGKIIRP